MGVFDTYDSIQLKAGDPWQNHYEVGDEVKIPDGVYLSDDGAVVIADGKLLHTTTNIFNYWGYPVLDSKLVEL